MHGSNQDGMVLYRLRLGVFPSFIKVQQHVLRWASSVLANVCVALLCWFSRRLFM